MIKKGKKENKSKCPALIIFIKNPELGKAKTRLAQSVGNIEALRIYKLLLAHTRKISSSVDADRYLFYHNEIWEDEWPDSKYNKRLQSDGDLGNKMANAFSEVLQLNDKAIIIGSDCSQLSQDIIQDAFSRLDNADLVLGPTYDGGYYLMGMKKAHSSLFQNMTWSVADVLGSNSGQSKIGKLILRSFTTAL